MKHAASTVCWFFTLMLVSSVARCQAPVQSPGATRMPCEWQAGADGTNAVCIPVSTIPATKASVPAAPQPLPNLALIGGEYSTSSSPHFSGFVALALPVSSTAGLYSYSMYQGLIVGGKLTTSTTTGLADDLKTIVLSKGVLVLVGLGTAGVSTGTATTGAFAGGGGLLYRHNSGWVLGVLGIQNAAGGTAKPNVLVGVGRTW